MIAHRVEVGGRKHPGPISTVSHRHIIKPYTRFPASPYHNPLPSIRPCEKREDYGGTDREDEERCNTIYGLFVKHMGRSYHMSDPEPLSAEEFRKAWWEIVKEGRTDAAGIQSRRPQQISAPWAGSRPLVKCWLLLKVSSAFSTPRTRDLLQTGGHGYSRCRTSLHVCGPNALLFPSLAHQ